MPPFFPAISVVVPVYMGETSLLRLEAAIRGALEGVGQPYRIILVNDASPDRSWDKIKELCARDSRITGIDLAHNVGQAAAISAGILHAPAGGIVVMDCDLQDRPEDIPALLDTASAGYQMVFARRTGREIPPLRAMCNRAFHVLLRFRYGVKTDPAVANFAFYSEAIVAAYRKRADKRRPFSSLDYIKGRKTALVEVRHGLSARGCSSYTPRGLFRSAIRTLLPETRCKTGTLFAVRETLNFANEGYGVSMRRLTEDKIEMVRRWRNSAQVAEWMIDREHITEQMQRQWFHSIDNELNRYAVAQYEGRDIGLCNLKNIDYDNHSAESGIFIGEEEYLNSDVPVRCALCGMDYNFDVLGLERITALILASNSRAIRFNEMLGFKRIDNRSDPDKFVYLLRRKAYENRRETLSTLLI